RKNTVNRLIESVTDEDLKTQDRRTIFLQRSFLVIYGWQDKLMEKIDLLLYRKLNSSLKNQDSKLDMLWYQNKKFLTIASSLSIGTHIFLISISAIFNVFEFYLFMNLICMNLLLILSIIYHYRSTKTAFYKEFNKS